MERKNGKNTNNFRCPFTTCRDYFHFHTFRDYCHTFREYCHTFRDYSHKNSESKKDYPHYHCGVDNTNYYWNNTFYWNNTVYYFNLAFRHITVYIPRYILGRSKKYLSRRKKCLSRSNNSNHSYMSNKRSNYTSNECCSDNICGEGGNNSECKNFHRENDNHLTTEVSSKGFGEFDHLWVQCEVCYGPNYKRFFKSKLYICEYCGFHLKMSSSDRIELSIDPDTWVPMDEDMIPDFEFEEEPSDFEEEPEEELSESDLEIISEFLFLFEEEPSDVEEEPYKDRIDSYQKKTGLTEAIQTGTGQLNGIPVAIGVMDFQFIGGSMGSVVGEKITRLIEHADKNSLPLILVCASGGARMQEGSLSLMQMAKISAALYNYQIIKKLFLVSFLTSPTTGGVTASFGMLGDIIISEPKALIAFAGKRVIEETLKITVPEGSQEAEPLFEKGLLDQIVERKKVKVFLSDLLELHGF